MPPVGPIYCETPLAAFSFPAEPINFYTNAVIVIFGIVALLYAARHKVEPDLWALATLLTLTGVGSFLWHGFRTPLTLTLDFVPGLFFLLILIYSWARRVWPVHKAAVFFGVFFALMFPFAYLVQSVIPLSGPPLGVVLFVIVAGVLLVYKTQRMYGTSIAYFGGVSILAALVAFTFRSIDPYLCGVISFGTHFLWHIFLSLGAYLGFRLLAEIDKIKTPA